MINYLKSIENDENSNQDNYHELWRGEKFKYQPKTTLMRNKATKKQISRGSS
jgi:hypothetical protein